MARLAPVQAVSHGHPMTSGIPSDVMNYYISWEAAELPLEEAQEHYTEELKLLPADKLHQYYENRINKDGTSFADGQPFRHLVKGGRAKFLKSVPSKGNWYLCMQKPFKLHPEFDELVSAILRADPDALVILHEEDNAYNRRIFSQRFVDAGCDMKRVFFIPVQAHHRLLALYSLSDVILDSYPAGGCTTTREVLELGKVTVTLPAKFLGSRWSAALYEMLGNETLKSRTVAKDAEEYVRLAVALGTNAEYREETESLIKENVHKLFRREDAIEAWTDIFLEISPVIPATLVGEKDEL